MKKITSILILIVLSISVCAYAAPVEYGGELQNAPEKIYTQKFSDVPTTYWAFNFISEMVERGVLNGYPDGAFRPDNLVKRAEFAKVMVNAAGLRTKTSDTSSFSDVNISDWYHPFVETAKDYLTGFTSPSGSLLYKPETSALREDIAIALVRIKGYDTSLADLSIIQAMFQDYDGISEVAKRYVAVAVERGLISGYPDGTFRAQSSITRAEAATLLWRAYQYGNDNKILDTEPSANVKVSQAPNATTKPTEISTTTPATESTGVTKKYVTETLFKQDGISSLTVDKNGIIYYIKDKMCYQFNNGSSSPIQIDKVIEYTNIINENIKTNLKSNSSHITTYYDKDLDDVILLLSSKDIISIPTIVIYGILSNNVYCISVANWSTNVSAITRTQIKEYFYFGDVDISKVDLVSGKRITMELESYGGKYDTVRYANINSTFAALGFSNSNVLSYLEYDLGSGNMNEVAIEQTDFAPIDCISDYNNNFYYFSKGSLYKIENDKTISKQIDAQDIAYEDLLTINGTVSEFVFDKNGDIIFYDDVAKAVRKLTKL